MSRYASLAVLACALLVLTGIAQAQAISGTTTLSVTVPNEASISITDATSALDTSGGLFTNPFTGATNFNYKIRTLKTGGQGSITLEVTTDFSPANGPSVTTPPDPTDTLTYSCTLGGPGTKCADNTVASTGAATSVASFGTGAKSTTKNGNTGFVQWSLPNDPIYAAGDYSAVVTFTISAT